ncbi:MAG: HAMP domain-containing sensor histidine kinase [Pirellulaceae bacterium]
MRQPKLVLGLYLLLSAVVCGAMAYVTAAAIRLDRAETVAKAQALQEQNIGLALWQMDTQMAPILAEEAARTYLEYVGPPKAAELPPQENWNGGDIALVRPSSEYVLLNFQWSPSQGWTSPQDLEHVRPWALFNGATNESLEAAPRLLASLREHVVPEQLLTHLPEQKMPRLLANNYRDNRDQQAMVDPIATGYGEPPATGQAELPDSLGQLQQVTKGSYQFEQRNTAMQSLAQTARVNKLQNAIQLTPATVAEGTSSPVWVGDQLLLARRVALEEEIVIQGCWLDWNRITQTLRETANEVLPEFELRPATGGEIVAGRFLATLPVEIVVPEAIPNGNVRSTLPAALALAWSGLLIGLVAGGALLWGVVRLSERRARFVAAVSHELRTPLTTFRLYTEMLAGRMVTDPDKQAEYHQTLYRESDRLAHLVENVLAYSRLERGRKAEKFQRSTIRSLIDRASHRLHQRCEDCGMTLAIEIDPACLNNSLTTDPEAVEQILFNLVDNACKYGRSLDAKENRLEIKVDRQTDRFTFRVKDNGPGVDLRERRRLFRPFSKSVQQAAGSAPGVGLGLALSRDLAKSLGGQLDFASCEGEGACLVLTLPVTSRQQQKRN